MIKQPTRSTKNPKCILS